MRFLALLPLLAGLAFPLESGQAAPFSDQRRLVVSAPDAKHAGYREQAALLLPAWGGLVERDFVIETRFGVPEFSVVLVGKDRGEKFRRPTPIAPEELFAIVDAMPMRQSEMNARPKSG